MRVLLKASNQLFQFGKIIHLKGFGIIIIVNCRVLRWTSLRGIWLVSDLVFSNQLANTVLTHRLFVLPSVLIICPFILRNYNFMVKCTSAVCANCLPVALVAGDLLVY